MSKPAFSLLIPTSLAFGIDKQGEIVFFHGEGVARLVAIYSGVGMVKLTGTLCFLGCMAFVRWWNQMSKDAELSGAVIDLRSFALGLSPAEVSVVAMAIERRERPMVLAYVGFPGDAAAEVTAGAVADAGRALTANFEAPEEALYWVQATLHPSKDKTTPYAQ